MLASCRFFTPERSPTDEKDLVFTSIFCQRMLFEDDCHGADLEALIEVADGSQWTIRARSMRSLILEAQDTIGRDLRGETYYVRYVNVNGRFDVDALNEFMAGLRG